MIGVFHGVQGMIGVRDAGSGGGRGEREGTQGRTVIERERERGGRVRSGTAGGAKICYR